MDQVECHWEFSNSVGRTQQKITDGVQCGVLLPTQSSASFAIPPVYYKCMSAYSHCLRVCFSFCGFPAPCAHPFSETFYTTPDPKEAAVAGSPCASTDPSLLGKTWGRRSPTHSSRLGIYRGLTIITVISSLSTIRRWGPNLR